MGLAVHIHTGTGAGPTSTGGANPTQWSRCWMIRRCARHFCLVLGGSGPSHARASFLLGTQCLADFFRAGYALIRRGPWSAVIGVAGVVPEKVLYGTDFGARASALTGTWLGTRPTLLPAADWQWP